MLPAVWLFRLLDGLVRRGHKNTVPRWSLRLTVLLLQGNDSLTVVQVCRALQLLLVLASDYCYLRLCKKLVGESLALYAFAFNLCSWSCSYMLPRTLANSVEYCLVIIGSYWLMDKKQSHLMLGMFVAALSVFLRPTSALYWVSKLCICLFLPSTIPSILIVCRRPAAARILVDRLWQSEAVR